MSIQAGPERRVDIQPIVSEDQARFLDGDLTAEEYVARTKLAAEFRVLQELEIRRRQQQRLLVVLVARVGTIVYLGLAAGFYIFGRSAGALASAIVSLAFLIVSNMLLTANVSHARRSNIDDLEAVGTRDIIGVLVHGDRVTHTPVDTAEPKDSVHEDHRTDLVPRSRGRS